MNHRPSPKPDNAMSVWGPANSDHPLKWEHAWGGGSVISLEEAREVSILECSQDDQNRHSRKVFKADNTEAKAVRIIQCLRTRVSAESAGWPEANGANGLNKRMVAFSLETCTFQGLKPSE